MSVVSDECKELMLDEEVANPPFDDAEVGLFTGSLNPTHATVWADITPVTGTGYSDQPLTGWTPAVLTGDFHAISYADEVTWTNSGGSPWDEATGWYYWSPSRNMLISASRFGASFTLGAGQSESRTPYHRLTHE